MKTENSNKIRILVTGANGTLGQAFRRHSKLNLLQGGWDADWCFTGRELDVSQARQVLDFIKILHPRVVINCAACNDVDGNSPELQTTNVNGPRNLATACREVGARLVHFSTNYVYGEGKNFTEESPTQPWNTYAQSKLDGEIAIAERLQNHAWLILRTSWIFGYPGALDLLQKLVDSNEFFIAAKQTANPTFAGWLVTATQQLLQSQSGACGIYNAVQSPAIERYDFAADYVLDRIRSIFDRHNVVNASNSNCPRPTHCTLDTTKLFNHPATALSTTGWKTSLAKALTGTQTQWEKVSSKRLDSYHDARGSSCELLREPIAMAYASLSHPGVVRGPHQHAEQSEWFVVPPGSGPYEIYAWLEGDPAYGHWWRLEGPGRVFIPKTWVHAYKNVGTAPSLILCFPDRLWRGESRQEPEDVIKWENRIDSPYQLPDFSRA